MLNGERVRLRMIGEADLEAVWQHSVDPEAIGPYYPSDVESLSTPRRQFNEHGFWHADGGELLLGDSDDAPVGVISFFRRVTYPHWDAYEIAYYLYGKEHHGKGYMTEALSLLSDYLFASTRVGRLEVVAMPENPASIRVAERCGYQHEGTARGAFLIGGVARDVVVMARLRDDPPPGADEAAAPS